MEKEELKRIIREALREFFRDYLEEWEYLWRKWVEAKNFEEWEYMWRRWIKKGYPPPWYFIPIFRIEKIIPLRETISEFRSTTDRLNFIVKKFESWAPECSERERIESIQREVGEIDKKVDKILQVLLKEER